MKLLREFGQQGGLQSFLAGRMEGEWRNKVHGISLGYDEYWLDSALELLFLRWWRDFAGDGSFRRPRLPRENEALQNRFRELLADYRPPGWSDHVRRKGYLDIQIPIVIKVFLRPETIAQTLAFTKSFEGYPITYHYRGDCVAHATLNGGDSVGPNAQSEGTLGGFLQHNTTGESFLITCGHVVHSQNSLAYSPSIPSGGLSAIGQVDWAIMPPHKTAGSVCNNRGNPNATCLDLALVKLDPNAAVAAPSIALHMTPISVMTTGDPVVFEGLKSGRVYAEIKDYNLWREITIAGQKHCFGDLFTIVPRHRVYLNTALAKKGDSGSWIMFDGPSSATRSWDGMLIAGDGAEAYCCFSENIMNECDNHYGAGNMILP